MVTIIRQWKNLKCLGLHSKSMMGACYLSQDVLILGHFDMGNALPSRDGGCIPPVQNSEGMSLRNYDFYRKMSEYLPIF